MTRKTRLYIMFGFIAVFLIVAPILLLTASGYRIDLKQKTLVQTGTLFLETAGQDGITIHINGTFYSEPLHKKIFIYNLLPGEYTVQLTKDGYYPWEKKVIISSNFTTFEKGIILIHDSDPAPLVDGETAHMTISPDASLLAYEQAAMDGKARLITLSVAAKKDPQTVYTGVEKPASYLWSQSSRKILIETSNDYLVASADGAEPPLSLFDRFSYRFSAVTWDSKSDDTLYALHGNQLYKLGLNFGTIVPVTLNGISISTAVLPTLAVQGTDLYYILQSNGKQTVYRQSLLLDAVETLFQTGSDKPLAFSASTDDYITLSNPDQGGQITIKTTQLADEERLRTTRATAVEGTDGSWYADHFISHTDYEVTELVPTHNQKTLITRAGTHVNAVKWHPDGTMIAIALDDRVDIMDVYATNTTRNTYTLERGVITNIAFDKKGEFLFIEGVINGRNGIWELAAVISARRKRIE